MVTLQKLGRIATTMAFALGVLTAPAIVWAQGSTPLPGSAGSRTAQELNQPNFPTPRAQKVKPHWPRLAPRGQQIEEAQQEMKR